MGLVTQITLCFTTMIWLIWSCKSKYMSFYWPNVRQQTKFSPQFQPLIFSFGLPKRSNCKKTHSIKYANDNSIKYKFLKMKWNARFEFEGVYNLTVSTTCSDCTLLDEALVSSLADCAVASKRNTAHILESHTSRKDSSQNDNQLTNDIKLEHIPHSYTTTNHSVQSFHPHTLPIMMVYTIHFLCGWDTLPWT